MGHAPRRFCPTAQRAGTGWNHGMAEIITLKENKDFRRLYYRGKSKASPVLVTYVMKNRVGETRVGITTSKKIGIAVKRNRARRVIRAAFSEFEAQI